MSLTHVRAALAVAVLVIPLPTVSSEETSEPAPVWSLIDESSKHIKLTSDAPEGMCLTIGEKKVYTKQKRKTTSTSLVYDIISKACDDIDPEQRWELVPLENDEHKRFKIKSTNTVRKFLDQEGLDEVCIGLDKKIGTLQGFDCSCDYDRKKKRICEKFQYFSFDFENGGRWKDVEERLKVATKKVKSGNVQYKYIGPNFEPQGYKTAKDVDFRFGVKV